MNIFYLDESPEMCATYHCDKHVVKMILESCQLLSNALPEDIAPYRRTHFNHPSSIWVRKSWYNWHWLSTLTDWLLEEWKLRYNHDHAREHGCFLKNQNMRLWVLAQNMKEKWDITQHSPPPQCMPDDCKHESTIQAYRNYYMTHKRHIAEWRNGQPKWFK